MSSTFIGTGRCATFGSEDDALQSSDWAIWIGDPTDEWRDRPAGEPLITNLDYGGPGAVQLTIVIAEDGTARAFEGIVPGPC